jgi:hypothetical protein
MEEKDRFDRFMQLVDFRLRRWEARRSAEWKISLSLWALLAATAFYVPVRLNMFWVSVLLFLIWVAYTYIWAWAILRRNLLDMRTAFYYAENAESILTPDVKPRAKPHEPELASLFSWSALSSLYHEAHWAFLAQVFTTTIFLIAAGWLLSSKPWPK